MPGCHKVQMPDPLFPITVARKTGLESLHLGGEPLPINLLSFWQWSTSDLVSNVTRGRLAEFIVANALGINVSGVRNEWDAFDLVTSSGVKVEVKSAAYVQSWFQLRHSKVVFRMPRTHAWDSTTNRLDDTARRQADVYVLAVLHQLDKMSIDPLNLGQWSFYAVPTRVLDSHMGSQRSISLQSVEAFSSPVTYADLATSVTTAACAQCEGV